LPDNDFVFGLLRAEGFAVRPELFAASPKPPAPAAKATAKPPQSNGALNQTPV
jgi:hypothetical protein